MLGKAMIRICFSSYYCFPQSQSEPERIWPPEDAVWLLIQTNSRQKSVLVNGDTKASDPFLIRLCWDMC